MITFDEGLTYRSGGLLKAIPGVEMSIPLLLTLLNEGSLSIETMVKGNLADLTIVNPSLENVITNDKIVSKCERTLFNNFYVRER